MQTNDCINVVLGPGQINDLLFAFYGGTADQNLQDAEYAWLLLQGATPANINDMWYEYLAGLGFLGALEDMQNAYWCEQVPVPVIIGAVDLFVTAGVSFGSTLTDLSVVIGNFRVAGFANGANNGDFTALSATATVLTPTIAALLVAEVAGLPITISLIP